MPSAVFHSTSRSRSEGQLTQQDAFAAADADREPLHVDLREKRAVPAEGDPSVV